MGQIIEDTGSAGVRGRLLRFAGMLAAIATALWFVWPGQPESLSALQETPKTAAADVPDTQVTPIEPSAPAKQTVVLQISGLQPKSAAVMVAVFLTADGFPDVTAASSTAEQDANEQLAEIPLQLPLSGMAAVAVFQDLDGNGVLTKNVIGLPTEPYGFSGNARATFGPPAFDAAAVDLTTITEPLQISVR